MRKRKYEEDEIMPITDLKIAICISGQLRKLPMTKLHRIASALGADVYIHTWDNEHNPHLSSLHQYFPDAKIAVEKYETEFDNILKLENTFPVTPNEPDNTMSFKEHSTTTLRYHYAQSYTVIKSLQMCLGSGKKYDYIFRCRTDIDLLFGQFTQEEEFAKVDEKIRETLYFHNKHEFHEQIPPLKDPNSKYNTRPFIASTMISYYKRAVHIQDWFWIMNQTALEKLCTMTPSEAVMRSQLITKDYQIESGHPLTNPPSLKTPSVWFRMFDTLGIVFLSLVDLRMSIFRSPEPVKVPGHGDIL